jgi:hypothetical protein
MPSVTLDTNVLPNDALLSRARDAGIDVAVISVTRRETEITPIEKHVVALEQVVEIAVLGESRLGQAVLGGDQDASCLERTLRIVSNGSFPRPGEREQLTRGQRAQLRDAMILCAHVRNGRSILISNDAKAFINDGRREQLQHEFKTQIMTVEEFEVAGIETASSKGLSTYKLVRAMCASVFIVPLFWIAAVSLGAFALFLLTI